MCQAEGRLEPAAVVDHVEPHKGDEALMWDQGNWQSLCSRHHDSDKQRLEKSGRKIVQIGVDGWPVI
jgi:5-methylcytosine-specific restriction endonuclease McrA